MKPRTKAVAVFAYNEQANIVSSLDSVKNEIRDNDITCYVLINGCTDDTSQVVVRYAEQNEFVRPVEISEGDKSNAWNVFMHEVSPDADLYIFLDGDCQIKPGSVQAMEACLQQNPDTNAIAALPEDVGRGTRAQIHSMMQDGGLAGNLYMLTSGFIHRIQEDGIRLPYGLIGDDSLVGALAYWNLEPRNGWDMSRIVVCPDARFSYKPLSMFSFHDLMLYYRRKVRYSLRYIQIQLIVPPLKQEGLQAMPVSVKELYEKYLSTYQSTWRGLDTYFDWLAMKIIKKELPEQGR